MTRRPAAAVAALVLLAGMPLAQTAAPVTGARPPEKPRPQDSAAAATADPPLARPVGPEPAAEQTPAAAPDAARPVEPAEPQGPQGPPVHQTLRESDFAWSACLLALHQLGTSYEQLPAIREPDQRDCGIARPIRVSQILPGIALRGGAEMRCDTARALGFWIRDFVRPAAARLPGAPRLSGLQLGTTYACRSRVGGEEDAKLSQHAFGNAIDISAFTFHDAAPIPVTPRQDSGDLVEAFQRAARGAACLHFTTVLGPGSNASHDDHLHLDIAARKGEWRLCQ